VDIQLWVVCASARDCVFPLCVLVTGRSHVIIVLVRCSELNGDAALIWPNRVAGGAELDALCFGRRPEALTRATSDVPRASHLWSGAALLQPCAVHRWQWNGDLLVVACWDPVSSTCHDLWINFTLGVVPVLLICAPVIMKGARCGGRFPIRFTPPPQTRLLPAECPPFCTHVARAVWRHLATAVWIDFPTPRQEWAGSPPLDRDRIGASVAGCLESPLTLCPARTSPPACGMGGRLEARCTRCLVSA